MTTELTTAEIRFRHLSPFDQAELLEAGIKRSPHWQALEQRHLKQEGWCRGCGGYSELQVHHIEPVSVRPDRELDPTNLITLCMDSDHLCHFQLGHMGNWRRFNPHIRQLATAPPQDREPLAMAPIAPPVVYVPRAGGPTVSGRMSQFGGPKDEGVMPSEGLALVEPSDLTDPWFAELFLPEQPAGTTGLARRLNPCALYLAMRWDYKRVSRERVRRSLALCSNPHTGRSCYARLVDWGPNERTKRIADCSYGLNTVLALNTDDVIEIALPWT